MNDESIDNILRSSFAARREHVAFGDLAQRATKLARQQAAMQLVRLRRMSRMFTAIATLLVMGVLLAGYHYYSDIAASWASTDAATTLNANTISTTWVTYQSPLMVAAILILGVIVGMAVLRQFMADDPPNAVSPML